MLIDIDDLPPYEQKAPSLRLDSMEPTWHPGTQNEHYTSKSRFERRSKELGLEHVGNEYKNKRFHPNQKPIQSSAQDVKETIERIKAGAEKPAQAKTFSEAEREIGASLPDWNSNS